MGGELAGQPTMVKPVVVFKFIPPCSMVDAGDPW
jgi:hypothetical protein